jgi:hypothetical protein
LEENLKETCKTGSLEHARPKRDKAGSLEHARPGKIIFLKEDFVWRKNKRKL